MSDTAWDGLTGMRRTLADMRDALVRRVTDDPGSVPGYAWTSLVDRYERLAHLEAESAESAASNPQPQNTRKALSTTTVDVANMVLRDAGMGYPVGVHEMLIALTGQRMGVEKVRDVGRRTGLW